MYDLEKFTLKDTTECGAALRKMGTDAASMEEVAYRTTKYLYDALRAGAKKDRACALVQFFYCKGSRVNLLASAGSKPQFNKRAGKQVSLPVDAEQLIEEYPVVAHSLFRLGATLNAKLPAEGLFVDERSGVYNVFYIADAPAEHDLVRSQSGLIQTNGIKSVIGYGGKLHGDDFFAVSVYSRTVVSRQTALAFRPFALNTKIALLPFDTIESAEVLVSSKSVKYEAQGT